MGSVAIAGIPDPSQTTTDGDLHVGNARGLGLLAGLANVRPNVIDGYRVVVRDGLGNPLNGVTVSLHFAGTGVQVHSAQTGGQVAACALNTIGKSTNVSGEVIFFPGTTGVYSSATPDVQVRAGTILLTTIRYRSIDLLATPGGAVASSVDGQDLNAFRLRLLNLGGETNADPETDYATEGPSLGITDGFDLNAFRVELLCGVGGAPIPAPCSLTQCP
jgi:hypothetical protein